MLFAFVLAGGVAPADAGGVGTFPNLVEARQTHKVSLGAEAADKTVFGQLTVDNATEPGFVTAWNCEGPAPSAKSDLNYDGAIRPVESNRLIVDANSAGEICFFTPKAVDLIVDVNGYTDEIDPIPAVDPASNLATTRRYDTRFLPLPILAGETYKVSLGSYAWDKTVIGQLTVDNATEAGFVTAWNCEGPAPSAKSDLNYDGAIRPVESNRLIVDANSAGEICFFTLETVDLIIDIGGTTDDIDAIPATDPSTGLPTIKRYDTRLGAGPVQAGQTYKVSLGSYAWDKTVIGQLTVDSATKPGFVTAWNCEGPAPSAKSDLNYDGAIRPVESNRLIVDANSAGEICFFTLETVDLIIDIGGTTDDIDAIPNRRFDTR